MNDDPAFSLPVTSPVDPNSTELHIWAHQRSLWLERAQARAKDGQAIDFLQQNPADDLGLQPQHRGLKPRAESREPRAESREPRAIMLTGIQNVYTNSRPDIDWNTCGQAAIATILDFHGIDPWGLPRDSAGRWNDGEVIDAIIADGYGPDMVFGWGTNGGRIAWALRQYGVYSRTRGAIFHGGWDQAWPELKGMLDRDLPVPVMLDLGRLEGRDFVFHWAIAYAYDAERVRLTAVRERNPTHQEFLDAWRCDFIFIPLDMKFHSVLAYMPGGTMPNSSILAPGQILLPNTSMSSTSGAYTLWYQGDRNLVLYRNLDGLALWDIRPRGSDPGMCVMQADGNLAVYDSQVSPAVWTSNTAGNPQSRLTLQNDGNLVIYRPDGVAIWATDTVQGADDLILTRLLFDAPFYIRIYDDLFAAFNGVPTATMGHWVAQGLPHEGRRGCREFDVQFYLANYGDLEAAFGRNYLQAANHWVTQGLPNEGRRGSPEFDVQFYLANYGDLQAAFGTNYSAALDHWVTQGLPNEGRRGSPEFDVQFYLANYPDLQAAFGNNYTHALSHWIKLGRAEGREGAAA